MRINNKSIVHFAEIKINIFTVSDKLLNINKYTVFPRTLFGNKTIQSPYKVKVGSNFMFIEFTGLFTGVVGNAILLNKGEI